ncbi:MAG: tol-pal system YbgF family protein [Candidatus Margulisiibacteriota bacterium]
MGITLNQQGSYLKSCRQLLSELSWGSGVENYVLNKIPFSYVNGLDMADRFVKTYVAHVQQTFRNAWPNERFLVTLVGGGNGLLAKAFVQGLKQQDPLLLAQTDILVLEPRRALVDACKTVLRDYPQVRVQQFVFDSPLEKPTLVIFNGSISSWPASLFEVQDGVLSELHVRTELDEDAMATELEGGFPKSLDAFEIAERLSHFDRIQSRSFIDEVMPYLTDHFYAVPATLLIPPELKQWLVNRDEPIRFSLSKIALNVLDQFFALDTSLILIQDFGFVLESANQSFRASTQLGSTIFFPIWFPLYKHWGQSRGYQSWATHNSAGSAQVLALTPASVPQMTPVFEQAFSELGIRPLVTALARLSAKASKKDYLAQLEIEFSKLPSLLAKDYAFHVSVACDLIAKQGYDEALSLLEPFIRDHEPFAISALFLMGYCHEQNKQLENAEWFYKQCSGAAPDFFPALDALLRVLWEKEDHAACVPLIKKMMGFSAANLRSLLGKLGVCYLKLNQAQKAEDVLAWMAKGR